MRAGLADIFCEPRLERFHIDVAYVGLAALHQLGGSRTGGLTQSAAVSDVSGRGKSRVGGAEAAAGHVEVVKVAGDDGTVRYIIEITVAQFAQNQAVL